MSDHIDGPRQIGDPSADLTDLFAFTSPENPAHTVLAANVFPTCGAAAIFSNAVDHSIVVRRAKVTGIGDATKFETSDPEIRFTCRFDTLERGAAGQKPNSARYLYVARWADASIHHQRPKRRIDAGWRLPCVCWHALRSIYPRLVIRRRHEEIPKSIVQR